MDTSLDSCSQVSRETVHHPKGSALHVVYGLHAGPDWRRLDHVATVYRGRIPAQLLPIADDPCGNAVCIGIASSARGRVFFWDHERETAETGNQWVAVTEIAPSFEAFIAGLFEWIDPNETEPQRIVRTGDLAALDRYYESGRDLEATNQYDRTLMEEAAIAGRLDLITALHKRGAQFRRSLALARQNAEFFPEHLLVVEFLVSLGAPE